MCGILSETRVNVSTTDATTVCNAAPCGKTLCASHVVSPRDLWLCVLPRWMNVNVLREDDSGNRIPEPFARPPHLPSAPIVCALATRATCSAAKWIGGDNPFPKNQQACPR